MMYIKQVLISILLVVATTMGYSQQDQSKGAQVVTASSVIQTNQVYGSNYTMQTGLPLLGQNRNNAGNARVVGPIDVRFPWGVLYLFKTFSESSFDVSKGFFGDKILVNWEIRNNFDRISTLKLYRREYTQGNTQDYQFVANVAPSTTSYEDLYVDGATLYEYKIVAEGIQQEEQRLNNFITGIGYRNPTAIVTGNVNFEGGNPVKDVIVSAKSSGSDFNFGSGLRINSTSKLSVTGINKPVINIGMFQVWLKPAQSYTVDSEPAIQVFDMKAGNDSVPITIDYNPQNATIVVDVDGSQTFISNYIPSGTINARGEDELLPISAFNTRFTHLTVIINDNEKPKVFINGRPMTAAYVSQTSDALQAFDSNYTAPFFALSENANNLNFTGNNQDWNEINVGGGRDAYIDEIRVYRTSKTDGNIRTDYSRYISGNDSGLIAYFRANEGVGEFAYDLSRSGFNYNKNHGALESGVTWQNGAGEFPDESQLGILGITDANGNYEINAIPYTGTGESFTITPIFGQHQFDPGQQLVFLGQGSEVVNQVNFVDISSFNFNGKILYDTRNVFQSFVQINRGTLNNLTEGDQYVAGPGILDEGYNYFEKSGKKYPKGEYWYNNDEDRLERYARVGLQGANVFIDGNIVLDANNFPVESDANGEFSIEVPIGDHFITVEKEGHEFIAAGRFPAASGSLEEFFEDRIEPTYFIDQTRVSLVGKVVGGSVEAAKPIGFGQDGVATVTYQNEQSQTVTERYSAKNNIGQASITLGYKPSTGNITAFTQFQFETNEESGEYRVEVMPLPYEISQTGGVRVTSNATISLLDANENLNLKEIASLITPEFTYDENQRITGVPYHYEKSFVYRSTPILRVLEQTSQKFLLDSNDNPISTQGFQYPILKQAGDYQIVMETLERYENKDDSRNIIEDLVPIIDGRLNITNNLALEPFNESHVESDENEPGRLTYKYRGGMPSLSKPFIRTINITYEIDGQSYDAENYFKEAIVLGAKSDGSQTFITAGPDVPDIILRDPPGSNSSATIRAGETISFSKSTEVGDAGGAGTSLKIRGGITFEGGGGLAGPVVSTETINDFTAGVSVSTSSADGSSIDKTYSFTQDISTSDDPNFVGAAGDLYIGQSKNFSYGSFDDVTVSETITNNENALVLINDQNVKLEVSKQKAMFFNEQPTETIFVYSQKFILNDLIPELEQILDNLRNGVISADDPGVLSEKQYVEQIRLWRNVIKENERFKYLALNKRQLLKESVEQQFLENLDFLQDVDLTITDGGANQSSEIQGISAIIQQQIAKTRLEKLRFSERFEDNISFDSGVGEISRSVETSVVNTNSTAYNLDIEQSFEASVGFTINAAGFIASPSGFAKQSFTENSAEVTQQTTIIDYTLKDNDTGNFLSVDIVNAFDGNGPIFSTKGGRTSCPYEGPELSYFYDDSNYIPNASSILALEEEDREQLSFATQKTEDPLITVEISEFNNIPEGQNAEFKLILENNADITSDEDGFDFFQLSVVNTSNPFNAITNLGGNGRIVRVPYGKKTEFNLTLAKSLSDQYDYEDIVISLESLCDPANIFSEVSVTARFVPSCSKVDINAPLNNFSYNRDTAFNLDGASNNLDIQLAGFNRSFNSFKKIDLEYRRASSPTWNRLQTYYATQAFLDEALDNNETQVALIDGAQINYGFDITGLNLSDGDYEIRARTTCSNGTEFIADPVRGRVDLSSPQKFGTPFPLNGIYATGSDLKARFSEDIFYNSAVSLLEIKGQTNQLPITNAVSLFFGSPQNAMTIENPSLSSNDLSIEFWMNNQTTGTGTILSQTDGLKVTMENGEMIFTYAGGIAGGRIANDGLFHHYTLTYNSNQGELKIIEDDQIIDSATAAIDGGVNNNNDLFIGGSNFKGNLSQLRLWNKSFTLDESFAMIYTSLLGNEPNLTAYYPMDEGRGIITVDKARSKNAVVTADWDIKPKGESYAFENGGALTFDNVGFAQLTNTMDATISFWVKTGIDQQATLFSNGKGDGTDPVMSNGLTNKWAIDMETDGTLTFNSEETTLSLTEQSLVDDQWHHVSIRLNRSGSVRTYIDQELVTTNAITGIGGFSGNKAYIGARGAIDLAGIETIDQHFQGQLDEFRLWNTLRTNDQEARDAYEEVDPESIGLLIYSRFNAPDPLNGNGPQYFHAFRNNTVIPSNAVMQNGATSYSTDSPAIKPARELIKIPVNHVINGDEIILEPQLNSFAEVEGQILDVTVHRLFDAADNRQQSPVTWSVFVQKNDVDWYVDGADNDVIDITKNFNEEESFELVIVNRGGANQPFNITNIPSWLTLSATSGTVSPASQLTITATIDALIDPGNYTQDLRLTTNFGLDQVQLLNLRVLAEAPGWAVDPTQFDNSMNIIGTLRVNGLISEDPFDRVAAFLDDEIRGVTQLVYDPNYEQYFALLTVYSDAVSAEQLNFKAWDASTGNIVQLDLNDQGVTEFRVNQVLGTLEDPSLFENTNAVESEIALNAGWNWVSLGVEDPRLDSLNDLTSRMDLRTQDRIVAHLDNVLFTYEDNGDGTGSWNPQEAALKTDLMYKMRFDTSQQLKLRGPKVDLSAFTFDIKENWNWLPFPLTRNVQLSQALANYQPTAGDVIKSQNLFAIYDQRNGWSGTLNFLEQGKGYMIKSLATGSQQFTYPASVVRQGGAFDGQPVVENAPMQEQYFEYSENMNAVVQLPESYDQLFIYDEQGILKGYAANQDVGGKELAFVTIYGERPENLTYYVVDSNDDLLAATNKLEFRSNQILGNVENPIQLKLGEQSIAAFNDVLKLYPNPFKQHLEIETYSNGTQSTIVELYGVSGRKVFVRELQLEAGINTFKINPDIASGPYILKVIHSNDVQLKKVIKN